ncbi:hypothetical protein ACFC58_07075 [Kitasatospora purpeofusca]|uniref:hypothetical protein n=1 Tax=Kitasatospora purpeofusca TaxID=67352 RepID=UPI0035D6020B
MLLSPHPFQRSGAWTAALLAGVAHPGRLRNEHLDRLAARIADDCERAGRLATGEPGWAWLVRLAGMYPQSPPVHPSRAKYPQPIGTRVLEFLGPDPDPEAVVRQGGRVWPCWMCQVPGASIRWGKDRLPLADSAQHINSTAVYGGGHPLCRRCRIALWALPYGTATTAGAMNATVRCWNEAGERAAATAFLAVSEQALSEGWTSWRQGPAAEDVLWRLLAEHGDDQGLDVLRWSNDNRSPRLDVSTLSPAAVRRLAELHRNADTDELRRAARTAGHHPLDLAADAQLLDQALATVPHWAAHVLKTLDPGRPPTGTPTPHVHATTR